MPTTPISKISHQLKTDGLQESLIKECRVMLDYCLANGKNIDSRQVLVLEKADNKITARELLPVYNYLVTMVKPATPGTLMLFEKSRQSHSFFKFLGPLPIVRSFMVVTIISLMAMILISLSPSVNVTSIQLSMLQGSGWDQVHRLAFLLACASVGASFYALFKMNSYISEGTFNMKYSATYWSRFVLGLVAGILLSELFVVFINSNVGSVDSSASLDPGNIGSTARDSLAMASDTVSNAVNSTGSNPTERVGLDTGGLDEKHALSSAQYLIKPILAILGGFSANLVHRILNRLIEAVESLFKGSTDEILAQKQQQLELQQQQNENKLRTNSAHQLLALKNELINNNVSPEVLSKVDDAIGGLVSTPIDTNPGQVDPNVSDGDNTE